MVPEMWSTTIRIFCHFETSLPFSHPNNPKNQNFEKMKITLGDIINGQTDGWMDRKIDI